MNKNMNLPAEYAVLSEEEMTYTQGGSDIGGFVTTAATVVGAVVQVRSQLCPGCRFQHHGGGSGSPERCSADPVSRESGIPGLFSVTCGVCCTVQ